MRPSIPEADWKRFRDVQPLATERFCQRILDEIAAIASATETDSHSRVMDIYERLREGDRTLKACFYDFRRSTALDQLAQMRRLGTITDEEFADFSPETRQRLNTLAEIFGA